MLGDVSSRILNTQLKNRVSVHALSYLRFLMYAIETAPILATRRALGAPRRPEDLEFRRQHRKHLIKEVLRMVKEDALNIEKDIYSNELVQLEPFRSHIVRYGKLYLDSILATLRKKRNKHKEFSVDAEEYVNQVPDYYARNFHFQTDGYLSEHSAELYEHQTEILFLGTLALMRRLLLASSLEHFKNNESLKVLEAGSGTGELTQIIARSLPQAQITCVDLSEPYIKKAKEKLSRFSNIAYLVGDATQLQMNQDFDFVVSSYCLHEMPREVRIDLIKNMSRHLKVGGRLQLIDSIQLGERPEFDWAIKQFPKDFHEPFYVDYIKNPIIELIGSGFKMISHENRFLSTSLIVEKL